MKTTLRGSLAAALIGVWTGVAWATPSTQIFIPSTDIQKFAKVHLNVDSYVRMQAETGGTRLPPIVMVGPTVGVLPWDKIQAEVGFDLIFQGNEALDKRPLYFHGRSARRKVRSQRIACRCGGHPTTWASSRE